MIYKLKIDRFNVYFIVHNLFNSLKNGTWWSIKSGARPKNSPVALETPALSPEDSAKKVELVKKPRNPEIPKFPKFPKFPKNAV